MSLPTLPQEPQGWNIDILDELTKILSIESETFDFKGTDLNKKYDELYNDICAMANTSGGHIVLGVGEVKAPAGSLIRFVKQGFRHGENDKIIQTVTNNVHNIEPTPKVEAPIPVYEKDGKKFYLVIKINPVEILKPHFTKNRDQCYVRIGNSSRHASRNSILHLFSNYREMREEAKRLLTAANFIKESVIFTSHDLDQDESRRIIPLIDVGTLKIAIAGAEWLIEERGLFGGHDNNNYDRQTVGVYYRLRELDTLNCYLDIYNRSVDASQKKAIKQDLCERQYWCTGREKSVETIGFLENLRNAATEFTARVR